MTVADAAPREGPWTLERKHPNNFDFLRFAFATLVIYCHAFGFLPNPSLPTRDLADLLTRGQYNTGWIAVNAFFVLSGFLVLHSWLTSGDFWQYLRKRVLRIYPGFFFSALVSLLVFAPLAQPAGFAYLGSLNGGDLLYNIARFLFPLAGTFPGNLKSNAYDFNASLWTIPFEFNCYLIVALLGWARLYRARVAVLLLYLLTLVIYAHQGAQVYAASPWPRLLNSYLAGMVFYLYRDAIPRKPWLLAVSLAFLLATALAGKGGMLALNTCGVYALMYAAFTPSPRLSRFARHGDFSYGIYLYAFPIQQLLIYHFGSRLTVGTLFWSVLIPTLAFAWLSWTLAEKPFLEWKTGKRSEAVGVASDAAPPTRPARSPLALVRSALVGLIALVAIAGWADVYLLRPLEHVAARLLHRPLPPFADGALLLLLTAWLGWGIATLYADLPGKRDADALTAVKPPVRFTYVAAVAPVYWSVALLMLRLAHDLIAALWHSVRS